VANPADPDGLRVGTTEREAAVAALGEHLAEGRLELEEYERRAGAAIEARTYADLRRLFVDLPSPSLPAEVGPGRLPAELREQLTGEGLLVLAEDLTGTMAYRRYRAPGQKIYRRTVRVRGTVAVSRRRLVVWAAGAKRVDLPFVHPLWQAVDVAVERGSWLRITIDAGAFNRDRAGRIVLRLRTTEATAVAGMLAECYFF
jgi:hypothetical protein